MGMSRLARLLLVTVTVLSGCSTANRTVEHVDAEVVLRPTKPSGDLVVLVHGAGFRARSAIDDTFMRPVVESLLERGITVAASDSAGDNWGSDAGVRAQVRLVHNVSQQQRVSRVHVLSVSMGGLAGLRALAVLPHVSSWVGIYPVCDVRSVWDRGRYPDQIARALGGRPAPGPVAFTVPPDLPMTFIASAQDTVVPERQNALECAERARFQGARVTILQSKGDHGDRSNYALAPLIAGLTSARP